jgi:hypothetical protein
MTAVRSDRLDSPSGTHDERVLAWIRSLADDTLAGRTVWCAAALPGAQAAAARLQGLLGRELFVRPLPIAPAEPPVPLALRLDAMLAGAADLGPFGGAARQEYARAAAQAEARIGGRVAPGDVVVLHDALALSLARPMRERGAHAIWHLRVPRGPRVPSARAAFAFLDPHAAALDAYLVAWGEGRAGFTRVAALLPAAGLVDVKETGSGGGRRTNARRQALAWSSILGDIVEADRDDHVGGMLHARPAVAAR